MSLNKHEYTSTVVRHMPGNQKVWGSILSQAEHNLCGPARIFHEFLQRNNKEKHEFKTREVHEKWS